MAIVLLGTAVAAVWLARINRQQAIEAARFSAENGQLRHRIADLERATAAETPAPSPVAPAEKQTTGAARPAHNPEDIISIQRLKLSLSDTNAAISRLQDRLDGADAELQNLRVENKRLAGSEADLKSNLAAANQAVDAMQRELKSSRDRVTQVEIAYQKLRDQSGGDAQKLAQLQQLSSELQDIHQRREVYLTSILRRYRQITDQYRSLAGVMQGQRTDAPATGTGDLARIQDSIAMAEEDLRQLNSLSAQARLIQKKMAGK